MAQAFRPLIAPAFALTGLLGLRVAPGPKLAPTSYADVKPIFEAHCTRCHSASGASAGLALDSVKGIRAGGGNGIAVEPGHAAHSLLMARILGQDNKPRMPLGFGPLSDKDIETIRLWIDQGCRATTGPDKPHWAYVAPIRPPLPKVTRKSWIKNPIDAFVLAGVQNRRLNPSPEADRTTLIRRVTLDLIGLPPTPAEVDAFVADRSPNAYEKLVDRLLASPHYGEKMALPWLDAARYADSNGFQLDGDTYQYVWRDWVVQAMNDNMPFDRFTILQLAGDLLPGAEPDTEEGRAELIPTAFNRNHMLNGEGGAIPEEARNVSLFDRVETTSTTWLGLTLGCARCHDHKYDPFTQRDYYSMMAFFNNVPETGVPDDGGNKPYSVAAPWIYADAQAKIDKLAKLEADAEVAPKKDADKLKKEVTAFKDSIPRVMILSDRKPRETHIYSRGNYEAPLDRVTETTPKALPPMTADEPKNRLGLARWIVSRSNPLTARVQVNRYWQTFFGQGLVRTPENFGVQGEPPTNQNLLDWLAVEFMDSGWNVKHIQKLIVMSATYRQSSKCPPELAKIDPENRLLARGARFRLPSLLIRDEALAASGLLNPAIGGKPVYPYQPKGIWDGLDITDERNFQYPQSKGPDLYRRSLYTFWRRTVAPGDMFDASTRQVCMVRMSKTSTPLHALTTLNDTAWVEAGRALAQRVMLDRHGAADRISEAFRLVCARNPDSSELSILQRGLSRALAAYRSDPQAAKEYLKVGDSPRDERLDPSEHAAYAAVCLEILNLDEALTRE